MRTIRPLLAIGALIAGSILIAVPTAAADGPSISATPATGLVDGQTVTVSGAGFDFGVPNLVAIGECAAIVEPPTQNDCDLSTVSTYVVSTDNFVETYAVRQHITTSNEGAIDCGIPNSCVIGGEDAFPVEFAETPILFGTVPPPNFRILNARLVHRVSPGEPVELVVQAVNDGPSPANWSIGQSGDIGLTALRATCPSGSAQALGTCVYTPAQRGIGQPATAVFTVEATPGFVGTASATICATDLDSPGSAAPSNMCEVVTTTIR